MPKGMSLPSRTVVRYGGFFLSVGTARVLGIGISAVTFPFLVRRLGVETYGLWSYVVALCAFVDVVANPGLVAYATQQVAAHRNNASTLVSDFLALRTLSALAATLLLMLLAHFEPRPQVSALLRWYGIAELFVGLTVSDFFLVSLEMFHARSLLTLLQQLLYAAGILLLVRSPKDIVWVPVSILGSALVANLSGWIVLWRGHFRPTFSISLRGCREMLVPSLHYAATTAMSSIYHRTGHLVVRWFLGDYALGIYAASVRFVDILRNIVSIGLSVLMPRVALVAQSPAGLRRIVHAAVSALASVSIPLMLGTLVTAPMVVPWLLGASYANAVQLVRWMTPYMLAAPLASLFSGTVLYGMGRYRAYLYAGTTGAATALILSLWLVRIMGVRGVCIAFVLAECAVALTAFSLIPRELRDWWKNPMIPIAAFASLLMVAAVRLANMYSSRPVLLVAIGVAVYAPVSALLGRKFLLQQFGAAQ